MRHATAEALAKSLMIDHGLGRWAFSWNSAKRTAGMCRFYGTGLTGEIILSRYYVTHATDDAIRETILHEIAHALAGHAAGHNWQWQAIARRIGSNGKRCGDFAEEMPNRPKARWQGTCKNGHTMEMHRAPRRVKACTKCCRGRFQPEYVYTWKELGRPVHYLSMPDTYMREWHRMSTIQYPNRMPR